MAIVGRPNGVGIEIAFGHHRLVALKEAKIEQVEIIVRDLSNEQMLLMMAKENMEEWGTSAWVELETVRSVIQAYSKGEIVLPKVPKNAPERREVGQGSGLVYTRATVAEFLGWTRKHENNGLRPDFKCEGAFKALDMIEKGFLEESSLKGLTRDQMRTLVEGQWSIHKREMDVAKANREEAERAKEKAASAATVAEREIREKQAKVYAEQADQHKEAATRRAKDFGKSGAKSFREGVGVRDVKAMAQNEMAKAAMPEPAKIHEVDDLADKIAGKLINFASGDDELSKDVSWLKKLRADLSDRAAKGLYREFSSLIVRLERMRAAFQPSSSSHQAGTGVNHGAKAIGDGRRKEV